jgi:formamidopyrimidine-DNA glycosylase
VPELPEVETVRRGLERSVIGRRVQSVHVTGRRTIRRQTPAEFGAALTGRQLLVAGRRGKYLLIGLEDGATLVVHLRMSGQLLHVPGAAEPVADHTHVRIALDDGSELRFVDPRTFGELFVAAEHDSAGRPVALAALGTDPLLDRLGPGRLGRLLANRRTSLKAFLLDQHALAGIGNLYADEILFRARLLPDRRAASLTPAEVRRLALAVRQVLAEAVELRGSSLRDARYRDLQGDLGAFQSRHAVYGRAGQPCIRCGTPIERAKLAGRSAHFCGACQR